LRTEEPEREPREEAANAQRISSEAGKRAVKGTSRESQNARKRVIALLYRRRVEGAHADAMARLIWCWRCGGHENEAWGLGEQRRALGSEALMMEASLDCETSLGWRRDGGIERDGIVKRERTRVKNTCDGHKVPKIHLRGRGQ
jgi:hypothetical protein